MIDLYEVWLPQLMRYADIIDDPDIIPNAWLKSDTSRTSLRDVDELIEQVFGDLDSEAQLVAFQSQTYGHEALKRALADFLEALRKIENKYAPCTDKDRHQEILDSREWIDLSKAAKGLAGLRAELKTVPSADSGL